MKWLVDWLEEGTQVQGREGANERKDSKLISFMSRGGEEEGGEQSPLLHWIKSIKAKKLLYNFTGLVGSLLEASKLLVAHFGQAKFVGSLSVLSATHGYIQSIVHPILVCFQATTLKITHLTVKRNNTVITSSNDCLEKPSLANFQLASVCQFGVCLRNSIPFAQACIKNEAKIVSRFCFTSTKCLQ